MKRIAILLTLLCLAFAGCGDDTSSGTNNGGGGNGGGNGGGGNSDLGSEPEPGPANEIDAQIVGSDGSTTEVSGSAEDLVPEVNQAVVGLGTLTVFLSSSDGVLTSFDVAAATEAIPGTVAITSEGASGTWLTIASAEGIYTSSGGSITVNQCPEMGEVVTGTFDVSLNDFFGGTSTLTGSWRATVAASDNSITCRVIEPDPVDAGGGGSDAGGGGSDAGGGGGGATCPNPTCDGPCCPLVEPVTECEDECFNTVCNPMDPDFDFTGEECFDCQVECLDIFLDDPECGPVYAAALECEDAAGCFELEDDEYDACVAENCCDEDLAVF